MFKNEADLNFRGQGLHDFGQSSNKIYIEMYGRPIHLQHLYILVQKTNTLKHEIKAT